jgi:hypothetical protein
VEDETTETNGNRSGDTLIVGAHCVHAVDVPCAPRTEVCASEPLAARAPVGLGSVCVLNSLWSNVLLSTASLATVALLVTGSILAVGLRSMSQPYLPLRHRQLIGRYMLAGLLALIILAGALALVSHLAQAATALKGGKTLSDSAPSSVTRTL